MMVHNPIEVAFFGTPQFAVPALKSLHADSRFRVRLVVTQPDRPAGRGQKLSTPPVKEVAQLLHIPVYQPESLRAALQNDQSNQTTPSLLQALQYPGLTFIVVVAYGKIIPDALLQMLPTGVINIHPSLLPRWRGAAPIQRALFAGDEITGTTIMQLDSGLDTGPILRQASLSIAAEDNAGTIHDKLAEQGAALLLETLNGVLVGKISPVPQIEHGTCYADKWEKEDLVIRWDEPASNSLNRIRASTPYPGARTYYKGLQLKILKAELRQDGDSRTVTPGTILSVRNYLDVATGSGILRIVQLQFPGKNPISASDALKSNNFELTTRFSSTG